MKQENIRNVAIIAHVDHGKTTLVDRLLWASHVFRENQQVEERVLDSNDQERERGITILSKNISITYKDVKINVIDTPGHADFGGEVERVLNMADGALLIVDAYEGPKPQTRFVLSHALERGLRIVVVVNKIDRPNADPEGAVDKVFDLMVELGASDEQLDFPVVYASAVNGYARLDPDDGNMDMVPLLDTILDEIPAPDVDIDGPVALQICTVDHSSYEGRIGVGRLSSGTLHEKEQVLVVKPDGAERRAQIRKVYTFENLGKAEVTAADAGDIVAVIGIEDADIGDIITELSAEKEELEEKETQLKDEQEKLEQANEALEENKSSLSKKISAASAQIEDISLLEKQYQSDLAASQQKAKEMEQKFRKASFDFNDFLDQMAQLEQMGGMQEILSMMPGMASQMKNVEIDENAAKTPKAIVLSMTPRERSLQDPISPSRKKRIADGAGVQIADVNRFLKQFEQSKKMMKQMSGMMGGKRRRGGFKMPFGLR